MDRRRRVRPAPTAAGADGASAIAARRRPAIETGGRLFGAADLAAVLATRVGVESETVALETVPAAALQLGESDTTRSAGAGLSPRPVRRRPRSRPPAGPGTRRYPAPGVESDAQLRRAWGRTVRKPRSRLAGARQTRARVRRAAAVPAAGAARRSDL